MMKQDTESMSNDDVVPPTQPTIVPLHHVDNPNSLAPFNPTCLQAQMTTLRLMNLSSDDVLFDLGCGDAQFLVNAATHTKGLRCVGIELNPKLISRGNDTINSLPVTIKNRIMLRQGDILIEACRFQPAGQGLNSNETIPSSAITEPKDLDQLTLLNDATAIFIFLLPKGMKKVKQHLDLVVQRRNNERKLFRVVSYIFSIPGWEPKTVDRSTKADVPLYLYEFNPADENVSGDESHRVSK